MTCCRITAHAYDVLLHIMCGYQCEKAVNKNDTREVMISFHGPELSNQRDCNNLVGPIGLHDIF